MAANDDDDDDVIAIKEEKKPVPKPKSKFQKCIVCEKVGSDVLIIVPQM